jgi:hypothetical protein
MEKAFTIGILLSVLFLNATLCAQTSPVTTNDVIYVGFLDDAREEMVDWKPGVARQRVIRPAFEKTGSRWKEVDVSSVPQHMEWTIAFHGRNLGQVDSKGGPEGLTAVQTVVTAVGVVPTVGSPSQKLAGLMAIGPTKVRRPLTVVSKPYFQDPDGWKRTTKLPQEVSELVRKAFRHDFPHVDRCKDEEIVERNWKFPDSALALPIAYASNKRSFLVRASLNAGDCGYVDDPDDPLSNPWFFIAPDGTVRRIGSFMTLLDTGDYDNDGKSELVFFLSQGEDTDGFVLYDANLQKRAGLTWHYH